MYRNHGSWPSWRWGLTGLSALGLVLSAYLAWHYLVGGVAIGCGAGSPCDEVLNSRWSVIGGKVPVSGLAEGVYLALLVAGFFIGPATDPSVRRLAWRALLVLSGSAAGSAIWFIFVQKYYIGAFCPYCMATHFTGLLLAALILWQAPLQLDPLPTKPMSGTPKSPAPVVRRLPALNFALCGVGLAAVLAACQIFFAPTTVFRGGQAQNDLPVVPVRASPLVGSPEARYVVTLLFDYNCPHCQLLHSMLDETVRRYHGQLAFALCPSPLNTHCNSYIPRDVDDFKDSCELAKISLALWAVDRAAFVQFDRWMFSADPGERWQPRGLEDATAKAVALVGQSKLDAGLADPWVNQYLQTSIGIYGATTQTGNAVPKLVFGPRWVIPEPIGADDLIQILHRALDLPLP